MIAVWIAASAAAGGLRASVVRLTGGGCCSRVLEGTVWDLCCHCSDGARLVFVWRSSRHRYMSALAVAAATDDELEAGTTTSRANKWEEE